MERALKVEMQKRVQRTRAAAAWTKPMRRQIDRAPRIEGILRGRKPVHNRQAAKDRRHCKAGDTSMFHQL